MGYGYICICMVYMPDGKCLCIHSATDPNVAVSAAACIWRCGLGSSTGRNMSRYSFHIKWQCRHCPRSYEYDTKQMIDELPETVLASSLNHQMTCTCTCAIDEFVDIPDCRSCCPQQALFKDIANGEIHRRAVVQNVVSVRSDVG